MDDSERSTRQTLLDSLVRLQSEPELRHRLEGIFPGLVQFTQARASAGSQSRMQPGELKALKTLHRLVAHPSIGLPSLQNLAETAEVKPPSALAQLRKLEQSGKVKRVETSEGPRYLALSFFRGEWVDPSNGINLRWQTSSTIDWRFPLVSRIADANAQQFLYEWLDRAQARNFLPAFRSRFEPQDPRPPLLQIIIYGSCARGDAGPKSDLDILLYGESGKRQAEGLITLAHEVALWGGRTPDIRAMDAKGFREAAPTFRSAIQHEGKTIFTNDPDAPFQERPLEAKDA